MEEKTKFVLILFGGLLSISLFVNFQIYSAKKTIERERDSLISETKILNKKIEEILKDNKQLKDEINSLNSDLERIYKERKEIQGQYELIVKERDQLLEKLKRARRQFQEDLKSVKKENVVLKGELKTLNRRKIYLEKKLAQLQEDKSNLERRFNEMSLVVEDIYRISELKESDISSGRLETQPPTEKSAVELSPIVVRPQTEIRGSILEIDPENNFVIIDLGEDSGIKVGDTFQVYREDKEIATIEVIQSRRRVAACNINQANTPIKTGDTIR